ncbi:unnamed protein product [Rangifer tarandus platyrhynchus]|uniref:Uncharacterized protein n=1 Tax=Rangifer tarandus platyrhynchus TaxID=3082113 RepID=A0ABN8YNL0_RANTA|nr:unnamed protein product [Rangifer tarandus platyrhynchus]
MVLPPRVIAVGGVHAASVPGVSGVKWKEAAPIPASVDCSQAARGADAAEGAPAARKLRTPRREQRQHVSGRGGGRGRSPAPPRPSRPGAPHPPELSCAVRSRVSRGRAAAGAAAPSGR